MWRTDGSKLGCEEVEKRERGGRRGEREKWELGSVKHAYKVFLFLFMGFSTPYGAAVPLKEHSAAKAPPI